MIIRIVIRIHFPSLCHAFNPLMKILFPSLLKYNIGARCQITSQKSGGYFFNSCPVVFPPQGFCAKVGWEPSGLSFLFHLAPTVFPVNHFTSLGMGTYWRCTSAQKYTHIYAHTHTHACTHYILCMYMQMHTCTHMHVFFHMTAHACWYTCTPINTCMIALSHMSFYVYTCSPHICCLFLLLIHVDFFICSQVVSSYLPLIIPHIEALSRLPYSLSLWICYLYW